MNFPKRKSAESATKNSGPKNQSSSPPKRTNDEPAAVTETGPDRALAIGCPKCRKEIPIKVSASNEMTVECPACGAQLKFTVTPEEAARALLFAKRPDFVPEVEAALRTAPLEHVRHAVATFPRARPSSRRYVVNVTHRTAGLGAQASVDMARAMGLPEKTPKPFSRTEDGRFVLHASAPAPKSLPSSAPAEKAFSKTEDGRFVLHASAPVPKGMVQK